MGPSAELRQDIPGTDPAASGLLLYESRDRRMAKILIIAGIVLVVAGVLLSWAPGLLGWFGRLPGDIRIERASGSIFVPITSSILISLLLSLILNLLFRR
jgi:hypothetical protein